MTFALKYDIISVITFYFGRFFVMIFIPVKWVPYILVIAGLYGFFNAYSSSARLVFLACIAGGGIWIYFSLRKKFAPKDGGGQNSPQQHGNAYGNTGYIPPQSAQPYGVTCASCGNAVQSGLSACNACGAPTGTGQPNPYQNQQQRVCPCGNSIPPGASFCTACGNKL